MVRAFQRKEKRETLCRWWSIFFFEAKLDSADSWSKEVVNQRTDYAND